VEEVEQKKVEELHVMEVEEVQTDKEKVEEVEGHTQKEKIQELGRESLIEIEEDVEVVVELLIMMT